MSRSDEAAKLAALAAELREQIERTIQAGEVAGVPRGSVTSLVSSAAKLYAAAVDDGELEISAIDDSVSTTEAMVLACAMLRKQHMTPFDLALWFSRTAPRGDASGV